ncbi:ankyrin repeat-containing domain protein, partial [Plectosphaerella plurivora]
DRVGRSPLHWAARQGDCSAVEQLISHGADPNIANITKTTPLMEVAASSTSASEAKYLMTKGLDIDHGNHFGRSSLIAAVYAQRTQSCKILLELGADVKIVDDDGMTILHVAAKGADAATMKLLTD